MFDLGGEVGEGDLEKIDEEFVDGREIARVVEVGRQRETDVGGGKGLVRSVGFDKESVERDVAEGFTLTAFTGVDVIAGEGEVGAEFGEFGNHLDGAAKGVEKEPGGFGFAAE